MTETIDALGLRDAKTPALVAELIDRADLDAHATDILAKVSDQRLVNEMRERDTHDAIHQFISHYGNDSDITEFSDEAVCDRFEEISDRSCALATLDALRPLPVELETAPLAPVGLPLAHVEDGALTVSAGSLCWALNTVALGADERRTIPVLSYALCDASGLSVTFRATNLDHEVTTMIGRDVSEEELTMLVPIGLRHALNHLPPETSVSLRYAGGMLSAEWPGGSFECECLSFTEFPAPLDGQAEFIEGCDVDADFVGDALDRVRACVSSEETRYYLMGVCITWMNGAAYAQATDGHRLASIPAAFPQAIASERPIVPKGAIDLWRRFFRGRPHRFALKSTGKAVIATHDVSIASKLIDGSYPETQRVFPKPGGRTMTIACDRLLAAARACEHFGKTLHPGMRFHLEGDELILLAGGMGDHGKVRFNVGNVAPVILPDGPPWVPFGVNVRYLAAHVAQFRNATLVLRQCEGAINPVELTDPARPGETFILMPLRV